LGATKFSDLKSILLGLILTVIIACHPQKKEKLSPVTPIEQTVLTYAKGFSIEKSASGISIIKINSPWPNAEATFTYALVPRELLPKITLSKDAYDAIITIPVERVVATSTTHIPALETLGVLDKLVGFPDTKYISSKQARERIEAGSIKELGKNEAINTEMLIAMHPDLVIGFSIAAENKTYSTLQRSHIPVVYNGDWTEESPLGKAEWIKFFAAFFQLENQADSIFKGIENTYLEAKELAKKSTTRPTILSGALYKDVWYLPGGKSWAAQFMEDANAQYLWSDSDETGSLSLSWESVLEKGAHADFWVSPSQYTSYDDMAAGSRHYKQFGAFKAKKIYTFANTLGETGGMLYFELAPQRPDLVLKDLIHIFHPDLLPDHQPYFFKPLE
tara:strand:+ start:703 stop:1872 length:1170 start_codon:yes stop_codon:yes gene_type:complete